MILKCLELDTLSDNFFINYHILVSSVYLIFSNSNIMSNPNHCYRYHFKFRPSCHLRRTCLKILVFKT